MSFGEEEVRKLEGFEGWVGMRRIKRIGVAGFADRVLSLKGLGRG